MSWNPIEAISIDDARRQCPDPVTALATTRIPAVVLRGAYAAPQCDDLVGRFLERGLMRDPAAPAQEGDRRRIDVGTSLGNRGADQEGFLTHAEQTRELFSTLFDGLENPVDLVYRALQGLAGPDRQVRVAHEPDGREYGPAIFRIHYDGHAYPPHIDHVTLREKRFNYAVQRFEHQFAGVLCIQNAASDGSTQGILHNCLWTEDIQPHLRGHTFHDYAESQNIGRCQVDLHPGDLYFFNTRLIHEVPAVEGSNPRIVLAVFVGFNEAESDIWVWA
ncbi:MAG: hypothetical protein HN712_30235 [Gemmatimonadetes bacterium]|jgi:hypothetical protein|nr:hypothetical protein [Gemmatimonadota bacterium]MBT7864623.1 hypothetical protein [Gemmatimonadota bacterium]